MTAADDARACAPLAGGGYAVATGGGLVLVAKDGSTRVLTSLDGLPDTRVHAVTETPGGLWVGTESGAALVRGGAVARTVGDAPVHAVLASSTGITIGTWGDGVYRLASETAPPVLVPTAASGKHVAAIAEHAGTTFVAYSDGPVARLESGTLRPLAGGPTHGQALASGGTRLLVGDIEGAFRLDADMQPKSFASVDVRGIAVGDKVLMATYGSGLLASTSAADAALRPEHGVPRWVRGVGVLGTMRCAATTEGLFVDEGAGWHQVALGGPPSNDVTTLAVQGDKVAVGTFDRGAAIHKGGAFHRVRGLEHDETVNASAWQGEGRLWLGTAHGLVRVDSSGEVVQRIRAADGLPSSIVRSLLVMSGDRLLVGTEEGAVFLEGGRITPLATPEKKGARPSLSSPMHATWAVARADDGTLFVGTASGLYYGKDGTFARASVSSGELADDWVTALAVATAGAKTDVLVGSYSAGVTRLTFDGAARPSVKHLAGGYVNPDGLTIRGGDLFAATMDGLFVRSLADDAAPWRAQQTRSVGRDVTATRIVGGALWVASRRGLAVSEL
jgi:ligand-binding sensor domain-containing protein